MTDPARRRTSFAAVAAEYERGRPGYPAEVVTWLADALGIGPGRNVLDLGAGTGKLTRQLVPLGAHVTAVEPLDEMRAELERAVPGIESLPGTAEAIPLPDASVHAITCGSAFHWFDTSAALPEMHRVLRPGGAVGLIWNTRDERDAFQREISTLIRDDLWDGRSSANDVVLRSGLFAGGRTITCPHEQWLSWPELADRIVSVSFVAALPDAERAQILDRVRDLAMHMEEPIRFAYLTEAFAFTRVD